MDVLVVLGTTASFGYALVSTIGYGNTKTHEHHHDHGAHFFETSSVLICFVGGHISFLRYAHDNRRPNHCQLMLFGEKLI
jgi:cation transport ATPase